MKRNETQIAKPIVMTALFFAAGCVTQNQGTASAGAKTNDAPRVLLPQIGPGAGKITTVEPALRFVVINFRSRTMPVIGSIMKVYRAGQPVGRVRLTDPTRAWFVTGDILEGELRVGDEVR